MSWAFYDSNGNQLIARSVADQYGTLEVLVDGLGAVIAGGLVAMDIPVDFDGIWQDWEIVSRTSGSIVFDIWKVAGAGYPSDAGDTIIDVGAGGVKPTLSSAQRAVSTNLDHWTTSFAAGDVITIRVDSASTVTRLTLALKYRRAS